MTDIRAVSQCPRHEHAFYLEEIAARFARKYELPLNPYPSLRAHISTPPPAMDHDTWDYRHDMALPHSATGPGQTFWEGNALWMADSGGLIHGQLWRGSVVGTDLVHTTLWHIRSLGGALLHRFHDPLRQKLSDRAAEEMGFRRVPGQRTMPGYGPDFWQKVQDRFLLLGEGFHASLSDWMTDSDFAQEASEAVFGKPPSTGPWFARDIRNRLEAYAKTRPHFTRYPAQKT